MDLTGKLIIKVSLGDDIRRIQLDAFESLTYDELILMMQRVFRGKLDASADLTLKYKDEDGDLITLFDSADLAVAISASRVLKLTLFINGKMSNTKPNVVSEDLIKELRDIRNRITQILDVVSDEGNINKSAGNTNGLTENLASVPETEVLDGKELSGIKLESKEFDPLQRPIVNDDQLSVSSQNSNKMETVAPPPPTPVISQQAPPAPIATPSVVGAPALNQPRYPNQPYAGYPGGGYPTSLPTPMTNEVSSKPVNGPLPPAAHGHVHHAPAPVQQPPFSMHQQIPGSSPQTFAQQDHHQTHQMQPTPQATSASAVVSAAGPHPPQMSAFMGYPPQPPQQQPPPGPPTSASGVVSAPGPQPVQASPFAPPRLPGAIQNHNNPYAGMAAGQRGPTPTFGRYPQAPAYQ